MSPNLHIRDLRFGNWIATDYDYIEFDPSDIRLVLALEQGKLKPIPLNVVWVRAFGFDDRSYIEHYTGIRVAGFDFVLSKPSHPEYPNYYGLQMTHDMVPLMKAFNYVHELQNMFFSITEKELETLTGKSEEERKAYFQALKARN